VHNVAEHIAIGSASLSSMRTQGEVLSLLHTAYDLGIRHYDTAPLYGRGYAELLIGKFAKKKRNEISIATKFGLGDCETGKLPPALALPLNYYNKKLRGIKPPIREPDAAPSLMPHRDITAANIQQSLNRSLQRLQTDYVDYFLLHEGRPSFLNNEAKRLLQELKQQGVIRKIGVATNWYNIAAIQPEELDGWDVLQYDMYNEESKSLLQKHPDKMHIIHSVIRNEAIVNMPKTVVEQDIAGYKMAACAGLLHSGKVLFSTRSKTKLKDNVAAYIRYTQ